MSSNNLLYLFLQKIRWPVLFSCKLITFNSNWSINSPGETVEDIVLDISENSHGNVYIEVLSKVVAYNMGFVNSSRLKFSPGFQKTEELSRGDLQE